MNDDKPKKEPENRRSRWVWEKDDIEIIENPDQGAKVKKGKHAPPASPASPDPAGEPKTDDDRKDG